MSDSDNDTLQKQLEYLRKLYSEFAGSGSRWPSTVMAV